MESTFIEVRMTRDMGKGVFAAQNIPAGTTLVQVHKSSFITYSLMTQHPFIYQIMNSTNHKIVEFCYFLAYSQHEEQTTHTNQMIKTYVQKLPKSYNNLICWSDEQLSLLENKELVNKIRTKKVQYRQSFNKLVKFLKEKTRKTLPRQQIKETMYKELKIRGTRSGNRSIKYFNTTYSQNKRKIIEKIRFQDIIKYIAAVQSRNAYYVDGQDAKSLVGALVPQLELFNHSQFSKCKVSLAEGYYSVTTTAPIQKDEQIFLDYGLNTTQSYLQFYGMIPFQTEKFVEKQNVIDWDRKVQNIPIKQEFEVSQHNIRGSLARLYNSLQNRPEQQFGQSSMRPALVAKNL